MSTDSRALPRISIVTPSLNQGRYIAQTIESVMAQSYPDVEHIVVDGGSNDGTLDVLARYPHLRVVSEQDRGHSDAINKGFRMATGSVCSFLNSDDFLAPGALHRVAQEIDSARGHHVVMGRCRFVDEQSRFTGIEHPCGFESHRRVLEIWKGHSIPQPAVFWAREVWDNCGPMDETVRSAWIDYDLFCRFSRRYRFHVVDQVLAAYRLHPESQTTQHSEAERLEETISISRRHWGSRASIMYWQLAFSLMWHRFDRIGRARRWLRRSQEAWDRRRIIPALGQAAVSAAMAPEVAFYVVVYPTLMNKAKKAAGRVLERRAVMKKVPPQTAAYLSYTDAWSDGWVGPRLILSRDTEPGARTIRVVGWIEFKYVTKPVVLSVRVDGEPAGEVQLAAPGDFCRDVPLRAPLAPGPHQVEIETESWYVPHRFRHNRDFRPLAWRMVDVSIHGDTSSLRG
jgi:glycosyltransferase involved in cell wall biosynthesis